jgi:hypothetical protein
MVWAVLFRPQSLLKLGSLGVAEGKILKFGSAYSTSGEAS